MCEEQRKQTEGREEEAIEDHRADIHFGERDFAEVKSAAPEGSGGGAGGKAAQTMRRSGHNLVWHDAEREIMQMKS